MKYVPFGRLVEMAQAPGADLMAYTTPSTTFGDYAVKRYKSRKALEAFCHDGSRHHAILKTPVRAGMLVNRNTQKAIKPVKTPQVAPDWDTTIWTGQGRN